MFKVACTGYGNQCVKRSSPVSWNKGSGLEEALTPLFCGAGLSLELQGICKSGCLRALLKMDSMCEQRLALKVGSLCLERLIKVHDQ